MGSWPGNSLIWKYGSSGNCIEWRFGVGATVQIYHPDRGSCSLLNQYLVPALSSKILAILCAHG